MGLKKLIDEHEQMKRNEESIIKLIKKEISKCLKEIIPTANFVEISGIPYIKIKDEVDKKFKFKVPDNYIYDSLNSIENIRNEEGKYAITKGSIVL